MKEQIKKAAQGDAGALVELNRLLEPLSAERRVAWSLEHLPGAHVLTSSFGVQAAVSLHLVTRQAPRIPVILLDTGYLFPETYAFVETLTERLSLNLKVYRSTLSPAWIEARFGKLWEQGVAGLEKYNDLTKLEPMRRALRETGAHSWFSGLRRSQSRTRQDIRALEWREGSFRIYPIVEWTDRDVGAYLKKHELPYHPMLDRGYVSIGDWHTTRPLHEAGDLEATRFLGLKRECGLHGLS
ncbi:MAG TPA: phosphoadenylyl-sulfate reductase [Steroidobacteraceae bacterium]|jgi:phosphoadenosine phosphosulfate reductase|nr:phosphoadenylyl-sulfate reductase [Steroidobacteraceae bacterium]